MPIAHTRRCQLLVQSAMIARAGWRRSRVLGSDDCTCSTAVAHAGWNVPAEAAAGQVVAEQVSETGRLSGGATRCRRFLAMRY